MADRALIEPGRQNETAGAASFCEGEKRRRRRRRKRRTSGPQ
jgi:hypothetical protein